MFHIPSDAEWVESRVSSLPARWEKRLRKSWEAKREHDYYAANVELRETTASLLSVRIPLDASDASLCEAAQALADRCAGRAEIVRTADELRAAMERICDGQGISAPAAKVRNGPAIARMCCPLWWRRKLRRHQGQTVEAAAIRLGYVSKFRDLSLVEATANDLHAYVVQSNNREYGDSRVRVPRKQSFERDLVRVRGGSQDYFVVADLDVDAWRQFQAENPTSSKGPFKPTPIGFRMSAARGGPSGSRKKGAGST